MVLLDSAGGAGSSMAATKQQQQQQLAGKYGMDVEMLEKLVRSVNVPSERGAGAGSARYVRDAESGEDIAVRVVSLLFFSYS